MLSWLLSKRRTLLVISAEAIAAEEVGYR